MKHINLIVAVIFSLVSQVRLGAQTEPQKSPVIGTSPSPANVNRPGQPPAGNPPPPVPPPASESSAQASPAGETNDFKNMKPIDRSTFDESVKPEQDFFLYAN